MQLGDEPGLHARNVWVGGVDEVEEVGAVPEVGVERYDAQAKVVFDAVAAVVGTCLGGGGGGEPALVLPEPRDVVVVPAKLLTERVGKGVWCILSGGVGVVVAEDGEDRATQERMEELVGARFGVLDVGAGELIDWIVAGQVAGVDCPAEVGGGIFGAGQGMDGL